MAQSSHRRVSLIFAVCILAGFLLGCGGCAEEWGVAVDEGPGHKDEQPTRPPVPEGEPDSGSATAPEGSAEGIVFSFAGENPSYHAGLLNETTIYLNYDKGTAWADESRSFQEPAGNMVRNGTDSVQFNGTYDHQKKVIKGTLRIRTTGKAIDDEYDYTNTVTYEMNGELEAALIDGEWIGTVKGTSQLTQEWEESKVHPTERSDATVNWAVKSVSIKKLG